ncbi:MAG: cytochrome c biogenesis heme-transporting ATPase CcmA [Betaproteobacteria bacterium]|nr:cytochrome c biogenesis heme-transporting ATPase CcmA [Betaproteobacteria bacterium]
MLELRAVACVRGGRTLFTGLDCAVAAGQLLRVQGANGAGKTSLLRMLCGLLPPAQGRILWRGESIADLAEDFGRELVYLGHAAALKDDLNATENLLIACQLGGLAVAPAAARAALQHAGLSGRDRVPARQLSQGQRRRVALARLALAAAAPLWVLDEPFNALDTAAAAWLGGLVTQQLGRGGVVVLTSHQPLALDGLAGQVELLL